ncbi:MULTISPECIES: hypothetical protein [Streptomyces]|uniref:Uncharacterized protein n=1 Tax=Streptomyces harbinensis TaxID=1176198 RepID=A0A1I6QSA6_9ACTN|nr:MULTISPECIES: hypothetical protein [Streptomyces]SFS55192.1 hypothetical protein SAMN05444716_102239 [Streptomyces harbinensis]
MSEEQPRQRVEKVTLDVTAGRVQEWDWIDIGGRPERVGSVTVLHNGRRFRFVQGGTLTLGTRRIVRVTRMVRRDAPDSTPTPAPEGDGT